MSDTAPERQVLTRKAREVRAGMVVMRSRREHTVVGAIATSAARYSITTRPVDEPEADLSFWVGDPDAEWQVVVQR